MKRVRYIISLLGVILLLIIFPLSVHAEDIVSTADDEIVATQQQETQPSESLFNADYQTQLEESLALNKELLGVYETWTSIISIILILVTIFGVAVPLYSNFRIDKKINNATRKMRKEYEKVMEKNISINNALMLSASKEYWSSNEILNNVLREDKENAYLHLLIGRNHFLQYEGENQPQNLDEEDLKNIEDAINHYLFVANHSNTEDKYFELGVIFPNSIIHELCILTGKLIEHSLKGQYANYHKLTVSVLRAIEKILGIKDFDDIANDEPTNVHIMNYTNLNHELAKSYAHFGNIKAREQYQYTLRLYYISNEIDYRQEIDECTAAISRLS